MRLAGGGVDFSVDFTMVRNLMGYLLFASLSPMGRRTREAEIDRSGIFFSRP
jgi:hypothetical protein